MAIKRSLSLICKNRKEAAKNTIVTSIFFRIKAERDKGPAGNKKFIFEKKRGKKKKKKENRCDFNTDW